MKVSLSRKQCFRLNGFQMTADSLLNGVYAGPESKVFTNREEGNYILMQAFSWEREIDERKRPLRDEGLNVMFSSGYKVNLSINTPESWVWLSQVLESQYLCLSHVIYCLQVLLPPARKLISDSPTIFSPSLNANIRRNFPRQAMVLESQYAKNPFNSVSNKEVEEIKQGKEAFSQEMKLKSSETTTTPTVTTVTSSKYS